MKACIVFREGHSGHFLRSVILGDPATVASFRMPDDLIKRRNGIEITLTHDANNIPDSDCVLRILPMQDVYAPIYNIFTKKILIEEFAGFDLVNWVNDPVFWYDKCYYHIQEYHGQIQHDISTNIIANLVDFNQLTNLEYLGQLLEHYFCIEIDANRQALIENYARLQLQPDITNNSARSMQDILESITDDMLMQHPWFWAYAVFKFECNNNLTEQDRQWSVNNFKVPQTRLDLLQYAYQIKTQHFRSQQR